MSKKFAILLLNSMFSGFHKREGIKKTSCAIPLTFLNRKLRQFVKTRLRNANKNIKWPKYN